MDRIDALHRFGQQLQQSQSFLSVDVKDERYILLRTHVPELVVIYFIDSPLSNRAIQQALRDNTMRGIFSLFILDINMLPADGTTFAPNGFLQSMQTLFHGRVYVYRADTENNLEVLTVQLRNEGTGAAKRAVYDRAIDINELSCGHVETSFPLQGFWGTVNFKAQVEYEAFNYQKRAQYNYQQQKQKSQDREAFRHINQGGVRTTHYQTLGVANNATQEQIKSAYRKLARQYHPDLNTTDDAKTRMQEINFAYQELMRQFD